MRKILLLSFVIPFCAVAQPEIPKNAEGVYEYNGVVQADSLSAEALYSNAKLFVVSAFTSGKDVTQLNDDEAKTVAGTGTMRIRFKGINPEYFLDFKFIIQCRDGRYKYVINNFLLNDLHNSTPIEDDNRLSHYVTKRMKPQLFDQLESNMKEMITFLKKKMVTNADDW